MYLAGKKIVLAVTGSIAAYKTPQLVRLLIKAGAEVKVILTPSSAQFVSPLALATVSRNPVYSNVSDGAAWNNHVAMGRWADAMVIAPCSANTLAKLANGLCDNLVCAVYLSAICPVFVAPAMDEDMWLHPSTKENINKIKSYGNYLFPVGYGELASGLTGEGRMAEPEDIVAYLDDHFGKSTSKPLKGVQALVTAGPTYEKLDPVRFIGNFSTGKMGVAIAEALAEAGANVKLILGPSQQKVNNAAIEVIPVESAREMYDAAIDAFSACNVAVLSAAVADYRPKHIASEKIKKQGDALILELEKTEDILATLGSRKQEDQVLIGFALETTNEEQHALEKLRAKNADMIVLNSLRDTGAGFGHDTNKITILTADGKKQEAPLQSKKDAAKAIVNQIVKLKDVEKAV